MQITLLYLLFCAKFEIILGDLNVAEKLAQLIINYRREKQENVGATWHKSGGNNFPNTQQIETSYVVDSNAQKIDPLHDTKTPKTDLTLEIAVFVDHLLWQRFETKFARDAGTHLRRFVFTVIQNAQLIYKYNMLDPTMDFNLVHYDVLTKPSTQLRIHSDPSKYLAHFCNYQLRMRRFGYDWDIAVLFTGQKLYTYNGKNTVDFDGYARMGGVCSSYNGCLIAKAHDFTSSFILAHELAHSFDVNHDEAEGCSTDFLLSSTIGTGQIKFSHCTLRAFRNFISRLDRSGTNCLRRSNRRSPISTLKVSHKKELPGRLFTADHQCEIRQGKGHSLFTGIMADGRRHTDDKLCQTLPCHDRRPSSYITLNHPALEGTVCAKNKHCVSGHCVPYDNDIPRLLWTDWSTWSRCRSTYEKQIFSKCMRTRTRKCISSENPTIERWGCDGHDAEKRNCPVKYCISRNNKT